MAHPVKLIYLCFKGEFFIKRSILRIVVETLGWIMSVVGAFFVFGKETLFIHYAIFILGIFLIVVYFPLYDSRRSKASK